jgi:hypothetical protein
LFPRLRRFLIVVKPSRSTPVSLVVIPAHRSTWGAIAGVHRRHAEPRRSDVCPLRRVSAATVALDRSVVLHAVHRCFPRLK